MDILLRISAIALCMVVGAAAVASETYPDSQRRGARYLEVAATPACAAVQLLADEQNDEIDGESAEAVLQWLGAHEQLNAFNRANAVSQALDGAWTAQRHNAFWLRQARWMLERDELSNVEHALRRLREPLDSKTVHLRQSLLGTVLLQQRRFPEAAGVLEAAAGDSRGTPFDRYNLALALIGQGGATGAKGRKLLDELGRMPAATEEDVALRDRIWLALGWSWLAVHKGGTARPYFRQVRLDGPYSNLALLGMGWAELAPNGEPQFAPRWMGFYHEFQYEPAVAGPERIRRALKPWQALKLRALHDPPAQEALLAIAYAHEKLRESGEAATAYRFAIRQYQAELARLDGLETALREPVSDPRPVAELQARPVEFIHTTASPAFARTEAELEWLGHCALELDDIRARTGSFRRELLDRLERQALALQRARESLFGDLRRGYLADIAGRRERLRTYLAQASFSLARLQDRRGAD